MRRILAVGAMPALLASLALQSCGTDPEYADACYLEGGTPHWVVGSSSPLRGWCDHPGPDHVGDANERNHCYARHVAPGPCDAVASESFQWAQG